MDARSFLLALGLLALPPLALTQGEGESGGGDERPATGADTQQSAEPEAREAPAAGGGATGQQEARERNFRPSERIRADQGVDFPADI